MSFLQILFVGSFVAMVVIGAGYVLKREAQATALVIKHEDKLRELANRVSIVEAKTEAFQTLLVNELSHFSSTLDNVLETLKTTPKAGDTIILSTKTKVKRNKAVSKAKKSNKRIAKKRK